MGAKLDALIATYTKYREKFIVGSKREQAALELADYVLKCNAFWTELEMRGRKMIALDNAMRTTPLGQEHTELGMELEQAKKSFAEILDKGEQLEKA